ncbi:MAG: MBOAT family protein [candidate division Zixibacteria bacterium]|nr:MBOAT family protein [candidate division Zixibacteria bacterium]
MLFNSFHFIIFFPLVVALYFAVPHRYRWMLLLTASYYFYMCWKAEYIILIVFSTLIDYFAARKMGETEEKAIRKRWLMLSLAANLGLLFSFKYFNFFNASMKDLFDQFNIFYDVPAFKVLLPVGISFYTFQTLSYTIDVYRGIKKPEKHLGIFAVYVSFFPQLVAGPIERSTRLLPQFFEKKGFDYDRVTDGLRLMLWGFFKKIVIADRLAVFVNQVYNNPHDTPGVPLILATYFFAFQIYCDFSGYSDIAIGSARIMGYDLMQNFRRPYFAQSIAEFWKRWHISLSTWFRDYLYISIGGNRVVKWRWYSNLLIVFIVSGFWHGANWTFMVWGALHGSYLVVAIWTQNIRNRISEMIGLTSAPAVRKWFKIFITFHLAIFAWIFFRANSLMDAFYIVTHLHTNLGYFISHATSISQVKSMLPVDFHPLEYVISFLSIIFLVIVHYFQEKNSVGEWLDKRPIWIRWSAYYAVLLGILVFGHFGAMEFIYFQF